MSIIGSPIPAREQLLDPSGLLTFRWVQWFSGLRQDVDATPRTDPNPVQLDNQNAAIGVTSLNADTLSEGLYRVSTWLRVKTAAGVSSSVQVTVHYTKGGVACTEVGTLLNANAVNVPQSDVFLLDIDAGSPISFSVAYASNPGSAMVYQVSVVLERVVA